MGCSCKPDTRHLWFHAMLPITAAIALAAASAQTAPQMPAALPAELLSGPMTVEVERDPISDAVSAFAVAEARNGRLAIGCDPDRYRGIRVSFRSRHWLAEESFITGTRRMVYRFDGSTPVRGRWVVDEDWATLRPWSRVPDFVRSAASSRRLTIRTSDIENRERDLSFSLEGGAQAIGEMLRHCRLGALGPALIGR